MRAITTSAGQNPLRLRRAGTRKRTATRHELALTVPTVLVLGGVLATAVSDGGFGTTAANRLGLLVVGVAAVRALALPLPQPRRGVLIAIALLVAYALWCYCSIFWADQRAIAWEGANRAALYALVFAVVATIPVRGRYAMALVGGVGLCIGAVGVIELLRARDAVDPAAFFVAGRFAEPVGYPNGNAVLWTVGMLACTATAARPSLNPVLRGTFIASATLLAGLALMAQSRGWAFALPAGLLVFLVLTPDRLRAVAALGAIAAGMLAFGPIALEVYEVAYTGALPATLSDATRAIVYVSIGIGTLAAIAGRALRSVRPRLPHAPCVPRRAAIATAIVGVLAAAALTGGAPRLPVAPFKAAVDALQSEQSPARETSRYGGELGTNRVDFWRVAVAQFRQHPLHGVGADNFQQDYLVGRRSGETPKHPHSLELGVLAQTGLVGAGLLFGGLIAASLASLRGRTRLPSGARAPIAAATGIFVYWLAHASVDWFWALPGLAAMALAMLALAAAVAGGHHEAGGIQREPSAVGSSRRRLILRSAGAGAALAAALSFLAPYLAERNVSRAAAIWMSEPDRAFELLERAEGLNPLSARAQLVSASIALRLGRVHMAERRFEEALGRDPRGHYATLELGLIAAARGERRRASSLLRRAEALNPMDEVTRRASRRVRAGRRIDIAAVNRALLRQSRDRLR